MDLEAYLRRVGVAQLEGDEVEVLRQLHRAHVTAIPFENIDVVLGRGISLDIGDLQTKLVANRRGGYCYEHNLLFAAVLTQLDLPVQLLVGRVQPTRPGPRTHAALLVEAGGTSWLADVGFGGPSQLLEPLPLTSSEPAVQDGWTYRIVDADFGGGRLLQAAGRDGWTDQYAFTLEPHRPVDYAVYSYNAAHNPDSPFVGRPIVQVNRGATRHRLLGTHLSTSAPPPQQPGVRELLAAEVPAVLDAWFGLDLPVEDRHRLRRRLTAARSR